MAKRKKKKWFARTKKERKATLREAWLSLQQGNLNAASQIAAQVVQQTQAKNENQQAQQLLAEVDFRRAMETRNPEQRLSHLENALTALPHEPRFHFYRGIALLQTDKAAAALQEFDLVAKTESQREGLAFFRQLARLSAKKSLTKESQISKAETNTLKLLEVFSKRPSKKLAETSLNEPLLGNPEIWKALLAMRHDKSAAPSLPLEEERETTPGKASGSKTTLAILTYYQGVAAMRKNETETAKTLWQQALSQGFTPPWNQKNVGLTLRQEFDDLAQAERWQEILKNFERLPANLNDDALNQVASHALFQQGHEQAEKGNWRKAVKYWQEASEKSHNRYLAQNLAIAQEQQGAWEEAAKEWREMLRRRPRKEGHPDYLSEKQVAAIWEHAATCYVNAYIDDEAVKCQRKAIQYDPQNLELRFKLISMLMPEGRGDSQTVIKELKAILDIAPEDIEALTQLAHLYRNDWRHDPLPLWKKILEIEPDNTEARKELAWSYVDKVLPQKRGFLSKIPPFKQRVEILEEGLTLLPNHPDLILALGIVHIDAHKDAQGRDYLLQAQKQAPKDAQIAAMVLQNLIHVHGDEDIEKIIPQIHQIPSLLPSFWVDQGRTALDHPKWARRFYEEALEHLNYIDLVSRASVLVDIYLSIPPGKHKDLRQTYIDKIVQEVPKSGAVEFIQAIATIDVEGNMGKAKRLLRQAKRRAKAANDNRLLQQIEAEEKALTMPPPPDALMDMLFNNMGGMGGKKGPKEMDDMLNEFMRQMESKHGKKEMERMIEDMLNDLEGGF